MPGKAASGMEAGGRNRDERVRLTTARRAGARDAMEVSGGGIQDAAIGNWKEVYPTESINVECPKSLQALQDKPVVRW